jgi:hypothetical protein
MDTALQLLELGACAVGVLSAALTALARMLTR